MTCKFKADETYEAKCGAKAYICNIYEDLGVMQVRINGGILTEFFDLNGQHPNFPQLNLIIPEEKKLKIEVGVFYRTRSGEKAFVFKINEDKLYPIYAVIVGINGLHAFARDGLLLNNQKTEWDLIEEWTEEAHKISAAQNCSCAEKHA